MRSGDRRVWWTVGVAAIVLGVGIAVFVSLRMQSPQSSGAVALDTSWVKRLPHADKSGIDTSHLADGVLPPTNKWFSGAVLQAAPQPVFAVPNSYKPTARGMEIGSPRPTATAKTIAAPHVPAMTITVDGAMQYKLTRYDTLTVDLTYYDNAQVPLARMTLVEGSPYMYVIAQNPTNVTIRGGTLRRDDTYATYSTPTGSFGVTVEGKAAQSEQTKLAAGQSMTVFSYSSDAEAAWLAQYAAHRVTGSAVRSGHEASRATTTLALTTHDGQPTVLGFMPHQQPAQNLSPYSRQTLYGTQRYASGTEFRSSVTLPRIAESLDVRSLGDADKRELIAALQTDTVSLVPSPADSYYGGKALQRKAQLLDIAAQLGQADIQKKLHDSLTTDLSTWLDPTQSIGERSFYYDERARGIVGNLPSFGSEEFNDHHFHYGYFIYAASVLARYDHEFTTTHRAAVESLIADIAQPHASDVLPQQRVFDVYMGHSWASGSAPFADGNNQESTAEAINAWTGVALWGRAVGDARLEDYGAWLLAHEAASARAYWTELDTSQPLYKGFDHTLMSLNWGGKRDYATFFSADPGAMLAIQLLPLNPTMAATLPDRTHIQQQLNEASGATLFRDYLAMYQAVVDQPAALRVARDLPASSIDDGNSRTYMLAWIMTRK